MTFKVLSPPEEVFSRIQVLRNADPAATSGEFDIQSRETLLRYITTHHNEARAEP